MPIARLGDVDLHWEERGTGPPLLLVPGIPALADDWWPFAEQLAATRRLVAYDNRGSGGSTIAPGPYTTAQLAADAVALLDRLGIDRADVLGVSLGGMIAQELALGWPTRVRRLVLGCTHAGFVHAVQPPHETGRAFAMETDDWAARDPRRARTRAAPARSSAFVAAFVAKKSRDVQPPVGYRAQIDAVLAHGALERLTQIDAPTLVITGDDDQVIPAENSRVLAERIPDARLAILAGAGHLFFLERPDETRRLLEEFLGGA